MGYGRGDGQRREKRKHRNGGDRGRGRGVSETVGETDKEMRQQRVGSKEGIRGTANDSEETGRKAEGRGTYKTWNALEPGGEE